MSALSLAGYTLALGSLALQALLWWRVYGRVGAWKPPKHAGPGYDGPLSILICARNEAHNLERHLCRSLNQNYRSLQVMVVNDNSTDHTAKVLFAVHDPRETFTSVSTPPRPPEWQGKKWALEYGIGRAAYEVLLLTDADGEPATPEWASLMMAPMGPKVEAVLGYAPYHARPGWLNRLIRYETAWTAIQYVGWALAGRPYMGVGRNLAYRKELFRRAGGMARHAHVASGDDDLFLGEVLHRGNTAVQLDPRSFVFSEPEASWGDYLRQKRRHLSASWHYRPATRFLLGAHAASLLLFYPGLLLAGGPWWAIVAMLLGRWAGFYWQMGRALTVLGERDLKRWIPVLDLLHVFYLAVMAAVISKPKPISWK